MLLFLDLETTGLDPAYNTVLEVAAIVTDDALVEVARWTRVVYWPYAQYMIDVEVVADISRDHDVDPYVLQMHTANGLWKASADSPDTRAAVDQSLAAFIAFHCGETGEKKGPQLAGSTISFDRAFMKEYLPAAHALLSYRNVDVTTLNELARRFWPAVHERRPRSADSAHRALADVEESLNVGRYYARALGPIAVTLAPDASEARSAWANSVCGMDEGSARTAELRQMIVDAVDVVEQSDDETRLVAALQAFEGLGR